MAGSFAKCGYKFGRWYDMIWMEKMISGHEDEAKPVLNFQDIDAAEVFEKRKICL